MTGLDNLRTDFLVHGYDSDAAFNIVSKRHVLDWRIVIRFAVVICRVFGISTEKRLFKLWPLIKGKIE